ncbi:hypothetical protein R6Q57_005823 [Mikania cordata]
MPQLVLYMWPAIGKRIAIAKSWCVVSVSHRPPFTGSNPPRKIQQKTETNPLFVLRQAIHEVTPGIVVKARRVGGSTHQVPIGI